MSARVEATYPRTPCQMAEMGQPEVASVLFPLAQISTYRIPAVLDCLDDIVHPLAIGWRQANQALKLGVAELECGVLNLRPSGWMQCINRCCSH